MTSDAGNAGEHGRAAGSAEGRAWRIATPSGKIAYFTGGVVALALATLLVAGVWGMTIGSLLYAALFLGWAAIGVRRFRAEGEPVAPSRPWWRMTGRPGAGWVLAAFFVVQVLGILSASRTRGGLDATTAVAAVYLALAVLYVNSSLRLRAAVRRSAPRRAELQRAKPQETASHERSDAAL